MADYGFRISQAGNDVKTCADRKTVLTSKYPNLKQALVGSGQVTVTGNIPEVNITHNLGYIPFAMVFFRMASDPDGAYLPSPQPYEADNYWARHYCNDTILKLLFSYDDGVGGSETFYYKYYIFLDKGNLW